MEAAMTSEHYPERAFRAAQQVLHSRGDAEEIGEAQTKMVSLDDRTAKDKTLVIAAKNGDSQAFEILVQRYRMKMLRVARRFTRNATDAEDIVQQSFQKVFLHLRQFEGHSSFSTWLTRIAMNEALMSIRRKSNTVEISLEQSLPEHRATVSMDLPDSRLNPEDSCSQREQKEILSAALNELTPAVRKAIELRDLGELSTEETARVMGLSITAVKARVFHGRKQLQKVMKRWLSPRQSFRMNCKQVISRGMAVSARGVNRHEGRIAASR
jgi:RNA polymerase sigma-70 factor, ECF subfamily